MYFQPTSLDLALQTAARGDVRVLAGGTDFYPANGEKRPKGAVLDVTRVAGLRGISAVNEGWRIGAATTWSDVASADLPPAFDGLKAAAREVGSVQIQNAGTVGGNLCNASPAADGVPPLLTLDCAVELASTRGVRVIDLADFLQGVRQTAICEDEILTALLIPNQGAAVSGFSKLGSRKYLVISIAMVAVWMEVQQGRIAGARIAVGACSPVAQRLNELEACLIGRDEVAGVVEATHLAGLAPIDDVRGSLEYRLDVVKPLIERVLTQCLEAV